jgi:hypothetical protein
MKYAPQLLIIETKEGIDKAITMGSENSCPLITVEADEWAL